MTETHDCYSSEAMAGLAKVNLLEIITLMLGVVTLWGRATALPPRPRFILLSSASGSRGDDSSSAKIYRKLRQPFGKVVKDSIRKDLAGQCTEQWRNATLDHFSRVSIFLNFGI